MSCRGACPQDMRRARVLPPLWLKPGVVIVVQDRENQNHDVPFLIGITQDTGDGSCIVRSVPVQASLRGRGRGRGSATNTQRRTEYINGTRFDEGDLAVSVKW